MWGTHISAAKPAANVRFIPTGVGNAASAGLMRFSMSVHPHGCGERVNRVASNDNGRGSSPRVWGTQLSPIRYTVVLRVIPTGVGNAIQHTVCFYPSGGSSPRVWGTQSRGSRTTDQFRFIPTGVGNAWGVRCSYRLPTVHPHGCGERYCFSLCHFLTCGSSPRVWGTRFCCNVLMPRQRFIPTGVGNA